MTEMQEGNVKGDVHVSNGAVVPAGKPANKITLTVYDKTHRPDRQTVAYMRTIYGWEVATYYPVFDIWQAGLEWSVKDDEIVWWVDLQDLGDQVGL